MATAFECRKTHMEGAQLTAGSLLCVALAAGCASPCSSERLHWVEIADNVGSPSYRILLCSDGGARVDVWKRPGGSDKILLHTVLVPCSGTETARLTRALRALIGTCVTEPVDLMEEGFRVRAREWEDRWHLACGVSEQSWAIRPSAEVIWKNRVLEGVIQEAQAVGHLDLALGIARCVWAEILGKRGDWVGAAGQWEVAWQRALAWSKMRVSRLPGVIYDPPEMLMTVDESMRSIDDKREAALVQRGQWRLLIEHDVDLARRGNTTIVRFRFPGGTGALARFLPQAIPPACLEWLRNRPWQRLGQRGQPGEHGR